MTKKALMLILALTVSSQTIRAENFSNLFYTEDHWGFIGKKFYDDPKASYNKFHKQLLRGITGFVGMVGGAAGLGYGSYKLGQFIPENWNQDNGLRNFVAILGTVTGGVFGFGVCYGSLDAFMKRKADKQALENFLANWQEYKTYTPESLHQAFNAINEEYRKSGWEGIVDTSADIIKEIRKQLANNDKRYDALYKTDEDFFTARYYGVIVSVNIADILRVICQIVQATYQSQHS